MSELTRSKVDLLSFGGRNRRWVFVRNVSTQSVCLTYGSGVPEGTLHLWTVPIKWHPILLRPRMTGVRTLRHPLRSQTGPVLIPGSVMISSSGWDASFRASRGADGRMRQEGRFPQISLSLFLQKLRLFISARLDEPLRVLNGFLALWLHRKRPTWVPNDSSFKRLLYYQCSSQILMCGSSWGIFFSHRVSKEAQWKSDKLLF